MPEANRVAPDSVSPEEMTSSPPRISLAIASSSEKSHCRSADRRSARMHFCGKRAISSASAIACAAGEDQIDRRRMADQPWQADGAEIDQGYAETAAEDAKSRVVGDHAHIRPQRQFHPAGHRKTLDRRDDRF